MKDISLSVILPIYNGMPYLKEAIKSLLNQTFQDFIIYAIDNGSTDKTRDFLLELNNDKIKYIWLEESNLVKALNIGLELATTPFVARMDADDISFPTRFEKQIEYLNENREIDLVGTFGYYIGVDNRRHFRISLPINHNDIILAMLKKRYAIIHASIMFRREIILPDNMYSKEYFPCEDFELFLRIGDRIKFANIPERLYSLRIRDESIMQGQLKKSLEIYYTVSKLYANNYTKDFKKDRDSNPLIGFITKQDILSLMIYRKGLNYYLNKNLLVGMFYFFMSSLLNPFRLFNALKRRLLELTNYSSK
ncbi:MAG: glycosyltransferase [Bacteroidetes bacterium]|nr:glycosyltransferase [Bacteroidota bacterium]